MSGPTLLFTLSLKHLSSDCKKAAADLPNAELYYISVKQLGSLLKSLHEIAPRVEPPTEPEIRITGPTGKFLVRVKAGEMHLVSWSSAHKGGVVTPEQVIEAVASGAATEEEPKAEPQRRRPVAAPKASSSAGTSDKLTIFVLGIAIVAVNCFTIWFVTRPPRSLAANYRLLSPQESERVLTEVAGSYETGKGAGDRRLVIKRDGSVQRIKFGAGGAVKDMQDFTVQPAESSGKRALLTSRKSLITVKDPISVVLYGDTYTKVLN